MSMRDAVRELRKASGLSQQAFAGRVGLSMRAIGNYEKDRNPTAKALFQFAKLAGELNRSDLAATFARGFESQTGSAGADITDDLSKSIVNTIHQNNGTSWLDSELVRLIRSARKGTSLSYPIILNLDRTPNQEARIDYLESLLGDLRMRSGRSAQIVLEELATERIAQTGETKEKAFVEILAANPKLYKQYNQEREDAARGASAKASLSTSGSKPHPRRSVKKAKKS